MKKSVLLPALAGIGLLAGPSHAFIQMPITVGPSFTATLTNFADPSAVFITGTGPNGTWNMGQFSYYAPLGQFFVFDGTGVSTDPGSSNFFADTSYNILTEMDFANLSLTETFTGGVTKTASLYSDLSGADPTTITNFLDTGTTYLATAPVPAGATLVSATLTGQFSDGSSPLGKNQLALAAVVPEADTNVLLLVGLALASLPVLAARRGRRTS